MSRKPKQWFLADEDEKFRTYRYEAGEGSNSNLRIDLRWSIKRELIRPSARMPWTMARRGSRSPGRFVITP